MITKPTRPRIQEKAKESDRASNPSDETGRRPLGVARRLPAVSGHAQRPGEPALLVELALDLLEDALFVF